MPHLTPASPVCERPNKVSIIIHILMLWTITHIRGNIVTLLMFFSKAGGNSAVHLLLPLPLVSSGPGPPLRPSQSPRAGWDCRIPTPCRCCRYSASPLPLPLKVAKTPPLIPHRTSKTKLWLLINLPWKPHSGMLAGNYLQQWLRSVTRAHRPRSILMDLPVDCLTVWYGGHLSAHLQVCYK